jgi:hypothetical protein
MKSLNVALRIGSRSAGAPEIPRLVALGIVAEDGVNCPRHRSRSPAVRERWLWVSGRWSASASLYSSKAARSPSFHVRLLRSYTLNLPPSSQ